MINNASWLWHLNYLDFLRNIGIHFNVNRMLSSECYKQRLSSGLSFFEINYMLMQSYDFLVLSDKYNCQLELGGDDQWSNILGGIDLIRKKRQKDVYGMTFNLLTTSEGKKMGKTEKGALWLDPNKTSPYNFYQYWRNIDDKDIAKCLKMLTFLPLAQIQELSKLEGSKINYAKEILAFEVTKSVHGKEEAKKAQNGTRAIFTKCTCSSSIPNVKISKNDFSSSKISIIKLLLIAKLSKSISEARRLVEQGGISILDNNKYKKIDSINKEFFIKDFINPVIIRKGKKVHLKIELQK